MANIDNPYMNGLSYLSTLFNPHNPYILHLQNVFNNLKQQQQQQQQQGPNDGSAVAIDPAVMIQNLAANMGQIINPGVGVNVNGMDGAKMSPREVSSTDVDATDGEPKSSSAGGGDKEYVSKMKTSRHHHHHHHHHHHNHNHGKSSAHRRTKINKNDLKLPTGTTTNAPSSTSPSLSSVSSASSSPLSSSSSSSLISSEPGSPVLLSPQPPQQQQKSQHQQFSHPIEQHINNHPHPHLIQNMMLGGKHLQQSYSVPKLASTDASSQKNTSPYYHTGGGEHFFAPSSKAGQTSSSAAASNEVKQKLKNLILQKLNKDNKLNQSTSNLPVPTNNNKVVKSTFSPKTESKIATPPASIRAPEHAQHHQQQQQQQQHKPTSMGVEMDENLLRRTTSEPNLKVKSALKDRLLEKRNLVNPFVPPNSMAKRANISGTFSPRAGYQPMYESQVGASMQLPPPPPPPPPAPNASLSTSLGSLHSSYNNQDQNSIFAAAAAAAAAAVAAITNQQQAANQQQDQKQQQSAAIAAAAASLLTLSGQQTNPSGNNNNHQQQQQQQLASLLQELAFQQQLVKNMPGSFDHNNNNIMPDHKLSASVSFPTLPRPQQYGHPMLQPAGYSQYGGVGRSMHHPHHHHGMLHPVTTKFGHIADVEEENELLLENELKCAAKLNDAASKNMYDEETHRNHHHQSWHKSEQQHRQHEQQEQLTPTRPNEDDNDEEGMMVESQQPSLPVHLGQHHPYHPKHQQQQQQQQQAAHQSLKFNKFNRLNRLERANSSQYYAAPHGHAKAQVEALNNIELIQRQLAHLQQQQQQQQDEELKRQQRFATSSSTNRTSYFSDPYLLKSFEIASISSNGNLNAKDNQENNNKQLANYFKRGDDRLLGKNNQVSCSTNTKNVLQTFISNKHMTNKTSAVKSECDSSSSPHVHEKVYRYTTALVYDPAMLKHECTCLNSSNHLETSDRIESIWNRFKSLGLDQECELVQSKQASIHDLLTCHSEQYALIYGSDLETRARLPKEYLQMYMMNMCIAPCNGIALAQDQDNSWNEEHTPVACRTAVGSTYELASLVYNGKLKNGFALVRPPGSHAEHSRPFGFCYFNTVACVAKMLKKNLSLERILIVDWDVHHGNGTQQLTYNDGNILYISLHRHDGGNFFPGTGSIHECGEEAGLGKNVNIAWNSKLNPAMSDAEYLAAFRCVVMPIAKAFDPQIVLVSSGFDATEEHPKELGGYKVSPMCFAYMTKKLMSLADGKVVLVLEGGYDLKSLCDCSELCLHALMNKQTPSFADATLHAQPNTFAVADLENVIQIQKKHWPMLNDYKQYIRMSHNQFISVYTE